MFNRDIRKEEFEPTIASVARAWDKNAQRWSSQVRSGQDLYREVVNGPLFFNSFVPDVCGHKVIDLGCGEGWNSRILAKRGANVTGIDISRRLLKAAKQEEASEPLGIRYLLSSFTSLTQFRARTFDIAISTMALNNSPQLAEAFKSIHRVLKPGGQLLFSVLHPCFWARKSRWLDPENAGTQGMIVSEYWDSRSYMEKWCLAGDDAKEFPFETPRFPHLLQDYVNGLCNAGFRITKLFEPRPTEEMVASCPQLLVPFREHAPLFLYLAAQKDAALNLGRG